MTRSSSNASKAILLSVKSNVPYNRNFHDHPPINLFRGLYAELVEGFDHVDERQKRQEHWQDLEGVSI
jgi:hypothetical protein